MTGNTTPDQAEADPSENLDGETIDRIVQEGMDEVEATDPPTGVPVLECPDCGKSDMSYVAGMETGHKYQCPHCGYEGAFVIERDRTPEDLRHEAGLDE